MSANATSVPAGLRRLLAGTRLDLELQARNGLYTATGLVLLVTLAGLAALPPSGVARLLPAFALNGLAVTAFFFSAALTLLENTEGSTMARAVTPLQAGEYLGARMLTLGLLGVVQHTATGLLLLGPTPGLILLAIGVALTAAIMAIAGFVLAVGKEALSAMLLPSVPWLGLLMAPLITDVLDWRSPLLWLHPLQGPLTLMRAAVAPVAPAEIALGLVCGVGWTLVALGLARQRYGV
jgi:fluoroquinolone transport system permease protein